MTEPKATARRIEEILPGVHYWHVKDDRIGGGESDAYAVESDGRLVLIDPLPVSEDALRRLGAVEAIVLTAGNHQRAAWGMRRAFGAKVYAPEDAWHLEEEPDYYYSGGDLLPGGLAAFHAPGPVASMYVLWLGRPRSVVFLSDILVHDGSGTPSFVASEYQDEPERTRSSVRRLIDHLPIETLCFNHGPPILHGARAALERALSTDTEQLEHPPPY